MARKNADSSTGGKTDGGLTDALAQFNKGVATSRQMDREQKAVAKAERRRDSAASKLKDLMQSDAGADGKALAEADYRDALAEWTRLTNPDAADAEEPEVLETEQQNDSQEPSDAEDDTDVLDEVVAGEVDDGETV
jgi:hypothetical protein